MAKMTKEQVTTVSAENIMKHSYNDYSGIKMSSNEYDAMEWNDVLVEANNLIYYTHETELQMQRYNAMNMAW